MENVVWAWITGGISRLMTAIKLAAAGIVGRILSTFGLSIVSFEAILPNLKSFVMQYVSGLPSEALNLLGALGVGQAMSMILSALTVRLAWKVFIVPTALADQLGGQS